MHTVKHTHADRLERWLGKDKVEAISAQFRNFYYPVRLAGVPGTVRVMPGGDFTGEIKAGEFFSAQDGAAAVYKKIQAIAEQRARQHKALGVLLDMIRAGDSRLASVGAFASIDAVVAAFTGGKSQSHNFFKTGTTANGSGQSMDCWTRAGAPAAGAAASAAPGGDAPTAATAGGFPFKNLGSANSGHYLNWSLASNVTGTTLLLYDRIFQVAKTMSSTGTEAVTGVPTRYQSQVATSVDYCGGNFCFPSVNSVLGATAHNWTVCQYTDDAGNAGNNFASAAGTSSCNAGCIDLGVPAWFFPLVAGDIGVKALTQMQCSASVTGGVDFVVGHPIAINSCPNANVACLDDGLYTTINLVPILDNACLSFIEMNKQGTGAANVMGLFRGVSE